MIWALTLVAKGFAKIATDAVIRINANKKKEAKAQEED